MAKKIKCEPDEMPSWVKIATYLEEIQPNPNKVTVANQRRAVALTIADPKGCIPKPKGGGGGERLKRLSSLYQGAQKTTGTKFRSLW